MKRRIARALAARVRELVLDGAFEAARAEIEKAPDALDHDKVRSLHADVLLDLQDWDAAILVLADNIRRNPGGSYAVQTFLHFDWQDESIPLVCERVTPSRLGSTCVFEARAAADLLKGEDFDGAFARAGAAIDQADDDQQSNLRSSLAMLFHMRGRLDMAQRLLMRGRGRDLFSVTWDLVKVRKVGALDEVTRTLLGALATTPNPHQAGAAPVYFDYLWETEGASQALFEHGERIAESLKSPNHAFTSRRIALAFELGDRERARDLLLSQPACANEWGSVLPIAMLLAEGTVPWPEGVEPASVLTHAELHGHLTATTEEVRRRLADPTVRVAIVGNSPCETGKALGHHIDGHDVVVRFNAGPGRAEHVADYGARTDVHVLPTRNLARLRVSGDAPIVLFTNPHVPSRNRDWSHALRLRRAGKCIACIPGNTHAGLIQQLAAPPSNGLRVCAYVASLRGRLSRANLFGFSFVDQVGSNPTSSHYFDRAKPSLLHDWWKERRIFDSLLEPG